MCLFEPKNWARYLPMIVNGINSSVLYNGTSRTQLYYGPLHYKNVYSIMCSPDFPLQLFHDQRDSLKKILFKRQENLRKNSTIAPYTFKPHQYVTDHCIPQPPTPGKSKELYPNLSGIFRMKQDGVFPKRLNVVHVVSGEERTLPTERACPPQMKNHNILIDYC